MDERKVPSTRRLYLQDDHCFENEATLVALRANRIAFDRSCFYPGGGGQPADQGIICFQNGELLEVESAQLDSEEVVWHVCRTTPPLHAVGEAANLILDKERRVALMRYHTVLHVLNTIALRDYNGWITGVQIHPEYSRIDFKLEDFTPSLAVELEAKVNRVLAAGHPLKSYSIPEEEFRRRDDLLRTLDVRPPISHGQVRVVEIEGFDAQACGGTHMHNTRDAGRFSIFRTDNKGRKNKRFYVRLEDF